MNTKPDYTRLYEFIEDQAGYFTAAQAQQAGFSWERLSNSVKSGKFLRVTAGVYRLAQFPHSLHADLYIAWLATGPHSVISHESALAYYDLSDALPVEIHVIVPRTASRRRENIRLHTNRLAPDEVTTRGGFGSRPSPGRSRMWPAAAWLKSWSGKRSRRSLRRGLVSPGELFTQAERRGGRVKRIILACLAQVKK